MPRFLRSSALPLLLLLAGLVLLAQALPLETGLHRLERWVADSSPESGEPAALPPEPPGGGEP